MANDKTSEPQRKEINVDLKWELSAGLIPVALYLFDTLFDATKGAVEQMTELRDPADPRYREFFKEALVHVVGMYDDRLRKEFEKKDVQDEAKEVGKLLVALAEKKTGKTPVGDDDYTEGETYVPRENFTDIMFG